MIRIFLLCKNDFFFRAIEPTLNENNISIAGICKEPGKVITSFIDCKADIVLMDANWNNYGFSGIDILSSFLKFHPSLKVIFMTNCFEENLVDWLKTIGVSGYFYRNVNNIETIVNCIARVYSGEKDFVEISEYNN